MACTARELRVSSALFRPYAATGTWYERTEQAG
jgi:hypothetical protein